MRTLTKPRAPALALPECLRRALTPRSPHLDPGQGLRHLPLLIQEGGWKSGRPGPGHTHREHCPCLPWGWEPRQGALGLPQCLRGAHWHILENPPLSNLKSHTLPRGRFLSTEIPSSPCGSIHCQHTRAQGRLNMIKILKHLRCSKEKHP